MKKLQPALWRPEQFELQRQEDEFMLAQRRQDSINRTVARWTLGMVCAGVVAAFLAVIGVL